MPIRIYNNSVSVVARSFALAPLDEGNVIVWLELAPQHPKVVGAIWASLVNSARETLRIRDDDVEQTYSARGLSHRYIRKTVDTPRIAGRARPKFMRLVAPEMVKFDAANIGKRPFYVGEWHWRDSKGIWQRMEAATALAAMLEQGTQYPIRIGWGPYLLAEAVARECALPLIVSGCTPQGYVIKPATPWGDIISDGIKAGQITLDGEHLPLPSIPVQLPTHQFVEA